jgi:transposase
MERVPVYVGLDYHSGSIQVCAVDGEGVVRLNRRCGNSVAEVMASVRTAGEPRRVAVEACCGAADLAEELAAAGWSVSLAHPGYVARMKLSPDKSDYGDARMLAELCRVGLMPEVWLAPQRVREMRALVRFRSDQIRRRRTLKMRILAVLREQRIAPPGLGRWSRGWLAWLSSCAEISEAGRWIIEEHLREMTELEARVGRVHEQLARLTENDQVVRRLMEMPGVGEVTAWTMRAMIGRFDRFRTGKQLARFCAVTPCNASSGTRRADSGLVRAGDPDLKSVLVLAAHRLCRFDPRWSSLAARLRLAGKPAPVIIAAVANRWVRWMHHEMQEVSRAA